MSGNHVMNIVVNSVSHLRDLMRVHHRTTAALCLMLLSVAAAAQVPVQVESVSNRSIVRQINVTGTVTSPRTAVLSTAVAGLVAELTIDEGHRVETGEALLKLDAELARLALERALAEVQQRETAVADARRRFAEAEEVGTQRGIARTQIESLRAEVSSDEAALVASQAAAREQQAVVERHTLRAPFAGVISERLAELGEWGQSRRWTARAGSNRQPAIRLSCRAGKLRRFVARNSCRNHTRCLARSFGPRSCRCHRSSQGPERADISGQGRRRHNCGR